MPTYEKTYNGTIRTNDNGTQLQRYFKFTTEDIGKYLVMKFRYQENMFWGSMFGTKLQINGKDPETLFAVYKIEWHSDWCKHENNVNYKIKLTPVGNWGAWCPDRSWYTSDIESMINYTYNLFEENPMFDNEEDANEFALNKNFELYPDNRSYIKKFLDKIFK